MDVHSQFSTGLAEVHDLIHVKVARGSDEVLRVYDRATPIAVRGSPVLSPKLDGPSVIWFVDKLSNILQRLCIHVKNVPEIRRLLIHVLDAEDLAQVFKNPQYRFVFEHPAVKIAVIHLNESPDVQTYDGLFAPTEWDVHHDSEMHYAFAEEFARKDEWLSQVKGVYTVIVANHRAHVGMGAPTFDTFMGFENAFANIPTMIQTPDVRGWRGALKGCPSFLVGAGPSVGPQLDFLREHQDRALIVAADTMLKPLLNAGIKPHIICSIERGKGVVGVLTDDRDHSDIFLCAQAALDTECFDIFKGPKSIAPYGLPISDFYPFDRIRFGAGHSCIGLGMALPPHMGSDPIYLMGIDLCWNDQGASHMDKVTYLESEAYKNIFSKMREEAFLMKNSRGDNVQTQRYWLLFKYEFENWTRNCQSKIYNLSPNGLPLEATELKTLAEVKTLSKPFDFSKRLKETFQYERHDQAKSELKMFQKSAEGAARDLEKLRPTIQTSSAEQIIEKLRELPSFAPVLKNIFLTDIFIIDTQKDRTKGELELAEKNLKDYSEKVSQVFSKASTEVQKLLQDSSARFY